MLGQNFSRTPPAVKVCLRRRLLGIHGRSWPFSYAAWIAQQAPGADFCEHGTPGTQMPLLEQASEVHYEQRACRPTADADADFTR